MQVFRALRPKVTGEACSALLSCLHKCLTAEMVPTALDVAVDVILTLQVYFPTRAVTISHSISVSFVTALSLWVTDSGAGTNVNTKSSVSSGAATPLSSCAATYT